MFHSIILILCTMQDDNCCIVGMKLFFFPNYFIIVVMIIILIPPCFFSFSHSLPFYHLKIFHYCSIITPKNAPVNCPSEWPDFALSGLKCYNYLLGNMYDSRKWLVF